MTRPRILTPDIYFKYFQFQENGACCGIEKESVSQENYFFAQTYLPKSFFHIDESFVFYHGINNLPASVFVKFELFAIGSLGESDAFIFRPWVLDIEDPMIYKLFENFRLYVPNTLFYNLIHRLIFLEQLDQESFIDIRILQDIPKYTFQRFGVNRSEVPPEIIYDDLSVLKIGPSEKPEILNFFRLNGTEIPDDMSYKYFNHSLNTWFKINNSSNNETIGYIRLYNTASHFTGGISIEYIIGKSFRNRGFATKAVEAIILYLKRFSYAIFVDAEVNIDNEYSLQILKKMGFIEVNSNTISSKIFQLDLLSEVKKLDNSFENGILKASIKNRYAEKYKKYI